MLTKEAVEKIINQDRQDMKSMKDEQEKKEREERQQKKLEAYMGDDRVITSVELEEDEKNRPEPVVIPTGFAGFDNVMEDGGFEAGDVQVIAGVQGSGKTTFTRQMLLNLHNHKQRVISMYLCLEENDVKFKDRMKSQNDGELPVYTLVRTRFIPKFSLDWIEEKVVETTLKHYTQVCFIDNLSFISDIKTGRDNRADRIEAVMEGLKRIAQKNEVVIVLISHLSQVKADEVPDMSHLRGSAAIGQVASTVFMLYRPPEKTEHTSYYGDVTTASLQKNRYGGQSTALTFTFNEKGQYKGEVAL